MQFHYCQKKKTFLPILDSKPFFTIQVANHYDKQLKPSNMWDQDGFLSMGLGYHQIQIIELEFYNAVHLNKGEYLDRLICKKSKQFVILSYRKEKKS